jgi:uncharacterized protein YndB with AHSA1/START domain
MAVPIKPAPVRKAVTVSVPQAKAFDVFTNGFGRWWPSSHSIGKSAQQSAIMEPRTGGRWYEIGEDGTQCDWGEVLVWEPPSRVLLAWRIGADWRYDSALLTEVEIRFIPEGEQSTRVELEHRLLENMGAAGEAARQAFESDRGWSGILASYVACVGDRPSL